MRRGLLLRTGCALVLAMAVAACLAPAAAVQAADISARIVEPSPDLTTWGYDPATITARIGDTVTWTNSGSVQHTITADNRSFDSGILEKDAKWTYTANMAGTVTYYCTLHPTMKGTLIVEAGAGAAPPAQPGAAAPASQPSVPGAAGGPVAQAAAAPTPTPAFRPPSASAAQAAPTATPAFRPPAAAPTPAPRAGGFPLELALPMLASGAAALGGGALLLRRGKKKDEP